MELKKRVLIISYYWPPSGGSGVQRWLKFTKYLPSFGWKPIVYTPSNPEIPIADTGLYNDIPHEAEILTQAIWEPYTFYKRFLGLKKSDRIQTGFLSEKKKSNWAEFLSVWIRGNFFIPDARRYWIKPSIKYLSDWLKKNPVDVIISTGPPHSMHMIAKGLREQFDIPWIADFRDPWTEIYYFDDLMLTERSKRRHLELEKQVLQSADSILVVGESMKKEFQKKTDKPITVITNGFDADDYVTLPTPKDEHFSLVHIGTFMPSQTPTELFEVLSELCEDYPGFEMDFRLRCIGKLDLKIRDGIAKAGLNQHFEFVEYVPHSEVVTEQKRAAVLLLSINRTSGSEKILTGKVFEYLAAKRPILALGNTNGDVANLLRETESGVLLEHDDRENIKKTIIKLYDDWKFDRDELMSEKYIRYSRESLTGDLVQLLEHVKTV
ncbi:glycosyltransferase [bacterium]|nr:MAG: glycosyltransferase [bacterium]